MKQVFIVGLATALLVSPVAYTVEVPPQAVDRSQYNFFNPTPPEQMRDFAQFDLALAPRPFVLAFESRIARCVTAPRCVEARASATIPLAKFGMGKRPFVCVI